MIAIKHNLYKRNDIYLRVTNIWTAIMKSKFVDSIPSFPNNSVGDFG